MSKPNPTARGYWGRDIEFLLSSIGYAVGLGNIWRFSYLCMRNGGGAFLIPYFLFLVIIGIPMSYLEFALGQFSSESAVTVFKICPLFSGIGWTILIINFITITYFNTIIAWIIYFLVASFRSWQPLWSTCNNEWNTPQCRTPGVLYANASVLTNIPISNFSDDFVTNRSTENELKFISPGEEYWTHNVLNLSSGIDDLGGLRWQLVLCLLAAWTIVFLCIIKGFKTSGKVVYVTATVPYLFLTVILIRGLTLPGSHDGIMFYISPTWSKILSFRVWAEACLQISFSVGPGWGSLITMSSFNRFEHKFYREAIIYPIVNCFTSFFAGFVIFSIIGHIAHETNLSIDEAVASGPGLAFVAYPEALSRIPGAAVWSALFFVMLLTVGLDSQFILLETVVSGICDYFPNKLRSKRFYVLITVTIAGFLIGLLFVTRAGMYWFQIVDWYGTAFSTLSVAILECIIVCYIYGVNRFFGDIEIMLGKRPLFVWKICWCLLTPAVLLTFLMYALTTLVVPSYGDYSYPMWAIGFGWSLAALSWLPIIFTFIRTLFSQKGTLLKRFRSACKPDSTWGSNTDHKAKNRAIPQQQTNPLIDTVNLSTEITRIDF